MYLVYLNYLHLFHTGGLKDIIEIQFFFSERDSEIYFVYSMCWYIFKKTLGIFLTECFTRDYTSSFQIGTGKVACRVYVEKLGKE